MKQFNVGYLGSSVTRPEEISYRVTSKKDLVKVIIPFFENYPTLGVHSISYFKWKSIIEYILESKDLYKGKDKKTFNTVLIPKIKSYRLINDNYLINSDLSIDKERLKLI